MTTPPSQGPAEVDSAWSKARNILAIRLDNLGDVLMTTPALAAIHDSLSGVRLTLMTSSGGSALAGHLPMVDEVIEYDAPWVKSTTVRRLDDPQLGQGDLRMIDELAQRRFDAAVIFTVCTQSALPAALMCVQAGIPLRLAHSRENPYTLLSNWVKDDEVLRVDMRHEVQRQLDLVRSVGLQTGDRHLRFNYADSHVDTLRHKFIQAGGDPGRPYFVIHPGASAPSRRYPAELFGSAAQALAESTGFLPVFCGGANDHTLVVRAISVMKHPAISLTGQLGLGELGALIAGARVTLCNNSGPAHLAAALRSPAVVLYALTNPQHTPWQAPARVLSRDVPCRHCMQSRCPQPMHHCLQIEPEALTTAALDLLDFDAPMRMHTKPLKANTDARHSLQTNGVS